jgi:outer membrane protein assembly factor BamB
MVRRLLMAWVAATLALAATAAQAQIPIARDLVPTRTAMARLGLERHWMAMVPIDGTERLLSINLAGGLLFAQTNMANFSAYDAESGRLLWSVNLGHESGAAQPASVNSRLVFVTNSNQLYALDRNTGRLVWMLNLGILPTSSTACDERRVMVGLSNGKLTAFELYDENDKNKTLFATPRALWNWQTGGGALTSRPLPAQQFVAFGGRDGKLYVSMSELPQDRIPVMLFRVATGGEITAPLGSYGTRTILVPSTDKNVYAVDLFSAAVNWTYPSGAPVMQEPLAADDDVYVVNVAGVLTALDAKTGEQRWMTSTHGGRLMSVSAKRIYLESRDDDLFIVDRGTGQVLADPRVTLQRAGLKLREYTVGLTNIENDRIYTATPSGLVMSLREIGQLQPRPLRDPKLPPLGFIPPEGALPQTPPPPTTPETPPAENTAPAP